MNLHWIEFWQFSIWKNRFFATLTYKMSVWVPFWVLHYMFSWNTPIKLFPPQNDVVNSAYFSLYLYFCEFSSNSIFSSILRLGEEFFTRNSYDRNFFRIKKYEVRAFQRRVERTCSPLQCWDILSWTSKSRSTLSFGERFQILSCKEIDMANTRTGHGHLSTEQDGKSSCHCKPGK